MAKNIWRTGILAVTLHSLSGSKPRSQWKENIETITIGKTKSSTGANASACPYGRESGEVSSQFLIQQSSISDYYPEGQSISEVTCEGNNKQELSCRIHFFRKEEKNKINNNEEFDPGSGWTLATGLTHASRGAARECLHFCRRPAHGWVTRMQPALVRGISEGNLV